jgi:dTDP-4-dehydrorhamnose reductase
MKAFVTGASGMLGADLCAALEARGHTVLRADRRPESPLRLDIEDTAQVRATLVDLLPDVVFHCAAWTDVDGAERSPDAAWRVNALGAWNVAAGAAAVGARLVYVSTDFVFDGEKGSPYTEFDPVRPLGAYAASKEAGERLVRQTLPDRHIIARTSWLFGPHGKNFVATIQRLGATRHEIPVVADQIGCPTHTADLARKLIDLAEDPLPGTYHVSGAGQCSWYDFACAIVERAGLDTRIVPITADDYAARFGSPTQRPAYSVLRHFALELRGMDDMPRWENALDAYLTRTGQGEGKT